jgi:hypothetical protein
LVILEEKGNEASLGAVVCLLHLSHVGADGTSKRLWKPVHTVGGKWLEKTRQHRSYIRHKRNMIALHPGTVKSRRTLSPLLKKKVKRLPLDFEIQMAKFSYCHHRVLRPNGSSRGIACANQATTHPEPNQETTEKQSNAQEIDQHEETLHIIDA